MKDKSRVEAALERSLRRQVVVPRLDRTFDAGVWARIEAGESRSTAPSAARAAPAPAAARWLYAMNLLGVASVVIFLCVFGAQMMSGFDLRMQLPQLSAATSERFLLDASSVIAAAAMAVGFLFTPWGRRLREELG